MSDTIASMRGKISSAGDLQSVVRTMKAVAASNIGQYEKSVLALGHYYRTVELGLSACFRQKDPQIDAAPRDHGNEDDSPIAAIIFGSDQGLVGQFNQVIADYAFKTLATFHGKPEVWAVGERVQARSADAGVRVLKTYAVPGSVEAITSLVAQIQIDSESHRVKQKLPRVYVFHNRPKGAALYEPVSQRLLPFDAAWQRGLAEVQWPTHLPP